jgi:transportin-1
VQLVSLMPDRLQPQLGAVIEYMLASTQDPDEGVAVEACEFWSAYPDSGLEVAALRPFLPRLLPVLLKNMVYEEYDDEVAEAEAAEEEGLSGRAPGRERDADVRPAHLSHGAHGPAGGDAGGDGGGGGGGADGEDGGGGGGDEEEVSSWNLRRCSAAGLDMLSTAFGDELLPLLLPEVQARLEGADWRARESAILALGAVAEGCAGGLVAQLPSVVAALAPALRDPRPMVWCIACWGLTRYSRWLLDRAGQGQRAELDALAAGLCERVGDHNWRVQEAACSSLATLAEEGDDSLEPYIPAILAALGGALRAYGRRALRNAYDAVAAVADRSGGALRAPGGAAAVLPPLFARLEALQDSDRDLVPLLECLTAVAQAAGAAMGDAAATLWDRCVRLADGAGAGAASGAVDKADADELVVAALDALSGLAEGLGAGAEALAARGALLQVLARAAADANPEVRQSAFALTGDLARACAPRLRPALPRLAAAALANLEPGAVTQDGMSACNNAAWALGELAVGLPPQEMRPYALPALERLARILAAPAGGLPRSLVENAAIALGRLAMALPEELAPHAGAFVGGWCAALRGVRDGAEKEHAFLGLLAVLRLNPGAGAAAFTPLCEAVVSWRRVACDGLRAEMARVMAGYREQLVAMGQWEQAMASLSPAAAGKLADVCQPA